MLSLEMLPQLVMQGDETAQKMVAVSASFYFYAILVTVCFILAAIAAASLWLKLRKLEGDGGDEE
jgi:hypothetical protein